jgi:toxin-antitoxin system PIN domain toxin
VKLPDINVLVYAHRVDDPAHAFYARWLDTLVNGASPFALSVLVAAGFVRVVSHPKFPSAPTGLEHAISFIEALSSAPTCRWVGAGPSHFALVRDLCRKTKARGARVSDAQHAAVAIEHGCTLVSRDSDFIELQRHGLSFELLEP